MLFLTLHIDFFLRVISTHNWCHRHLHINSQLLYLLVRIYLYFVSLTFHYSRVDHVRACSTLLQLEAATLHAVESILLCICMSP